MNEYDRIAAVIRYLDAHHVEQPDLARLAASTGLSPSHFHRLFRAWAGVTPKDFLQCLTLAHARALLRRGESVLDAAMEAGLSGPGRLHDLCVTLEAASPGEVKSGGAGWTVAWGNAETPFGVALIAEGPRGICALGFHAGDPGDGLARLQADWPAARLQRDDALAARLARRVFAPAAEAGARVPLSATVRGTAFQLRVWRALLAVPAGSVVSYGQLACAVGRPRAARAVGSAVARNPLALVIPCHRVIRETGAVGDYRWGTTRKRAMLARESCSAAAAGGGTGAAA